MKNILVKWQGRGTLQDEFPQDSTHQQHLNRVALAKARRQGRIVRRPKEGR